jgi:hypothetical protein
MYNKTATTKQMKAQIPEVKYHTNNIIDVKQKQIKNNGFQQFIQALGP